MDCGGVLDIRSSIRYLNHFYSYPLMPSMTRSGVLQNFRHGKTASHQLPYCCKPPSPGPNSWRRYARMSRRFRMRYAAKKVTRVHGHITKTALPSQSSQLDILEQRATRVPLDVVGEPPPSLPPKPNDVARAPPLSLPPKPNAAPPPAALPVVLPLDPPDETIPTPPLVPTRSPAVVVAERAHLLAPPHFLPRLNKASTGSTTGNSGDNAPMAEPPDPLANSRVAFAAL